MAKVDRELVDELTRRLIDQGKIIAAGFASLRFQAIPADAPEIQIREMEKAFFAGAQHLWGSIVSVLQEDEEPTEDDLRRMGLINAELEEFGRRLAAELGVEGHA